MSSRHLGLAAIGALMAPAVLAAQLPRSTGVQNRAPDKNASQIMITAFKSVEKGPNNIGARAAEEMRNKVDGAFPFKQVYVIPVERINPQLEASQFPTTEALEPHDSKALAGMLRADEYIAGEITKTATGFRTTADLVLTRDINARQPLGVGEAPKIGDAINILVKEMKEARKQLDGEKKCTNAAREGKFAEAKTFAQEAITAYPKSTLARMCLASVLYTSKAPTPEVVAVARELSSLDSRSNVGLRYLVEAYRTAKQNDSLVMVLSQMMKNDPKNAEFANAAVAEIATTQSAALARPIIDSAIVLNPGDPDLLKTRWQILRATKSYKEMYEAGKELMRLDTAFADTTYFLYTATAFASDSQWQQAAATAAEGLSKFKSNATLAGLEVQFLDRAGQTQQALDKLDRAIAAKVPISNAQGLRLTFFQTLKKTPLEIVAAAREAVAAGDTTEAVRFIVINQANAEFSAAQKLMATDAPAAMAQFNSALNILAWVDSTASKAQKAPIAFLKGAANILLARVKFDNANTTKNCAIAKEAKANNVEGQINLPQGASPSNAQIMQQLMGMAMQQDPAIDQLVKSIPKCS